MAVAIDLAATAEQKALDALKKKQAEDAALMGVYQTGSQGIYDTSKGAASGLLGTSKSDIEALYGKGYTNLQNLVGQESEAAIQQSLRPIEGKLAKQGLLGGPSGALNEALAGASERVRQAGIGRLADYQGQMTGALANVYGSTATQQANLEDVYGQRSQGLMSTALQNALANTGAGLDITNRYTGAGLEAALNSEQLAQQQKGQGEVIAQQGALTSALSTQNAQEQANLFDAQNVQAATNLKTQQTAWDRQYSSLYNNLSAGLARNAVNEYNVKQQVLKQLGPRPA